MKKVIEADQRYIDMLDDIYTDINNDKRNVKRKTKVSDAIEKHYKEELKKLEKFCLQLIDKDIENISSKNEALDYIQLWDYYRNKCAISKDSISNLSIEKVSKEDNSKLLSKVQHNLFEKCKEYDALNIENEKIFNGLIKAQLYDVSSARISEDGKKVLISDQYMINEFRKTKKGSLVIDVFLSDKFIRKNKKGIVSGKKILAQREKEEKER